MSITRLLVPAAAVLLGACSSHHAVRVRCDTRLQPINVPTPVVESSSSLNQLPPATRAPVPATEERGGGEDSPSGVGAPAGRGSAEQESRRP